ncbi:putative E3 ubiquitin-protein ligase HERC4 [Lamellibrachia satsuma]|nr:putative E3 ubiquitin-protein ligase HERC4 [Lamellibrachia satsuma]
MLQGLYFCDYPFVFDAEAKTLLLQTDAFIQMQVAIDEVVRRNITPMDIDIPVLLLLVKRTNLVPETIAQLAKQNTSDLKKPLKVVFLGEEGLDAGGVRKEFFLLLLQDLTDPKYGMFQYYDESRLLWFKKETFEDSAMFFLVGEVCGLAIYNSTIIDLHFPQALYKKLLRRPVTVEDMKELDPTVGKSLEDLLAYDGDNIEDVFCLNFQVTHEEYGVITQVDLCPDGASILVNKENRQQYVDAYLKYVFSDSVAVQLKAFCDGFHRVCGGRVLELFHPKELQAMVVGSENYDWGELEKVTEYKGEYTPVHPTIVLFWQVFHELSLRQKKKFLFFLTGSDRIPIHGMKAMKMFIQSTAGGTDYLPVAHTCFNLLDLPQYDNKDTLRAKLLQAMQETEGFGLV